MGASLLVDLGSRGHSRLALVVGRESERLSGDLDHRLPFGVGACYARSLDIFIEETSVYGKAESIHRCADTLASGK